MVPGDGACAPNCAAAFFFQDEVFGPKLRKQMNYFQAQYWFKKYQFLTQCSAEHPFTRKVRGGEVSFTDPIKLIKYLNNSDDADYMWSDSNDLVVISDMYQVKIKIITSKGISDKNPSVNWIFPDKEMERFAELKNVK